MLKRASVRIRSQPRLIVKKGALWRSLQLSTGRYSLSTASVLGHLRIHSIRPGRNASGQVADFLESGLLQEGYCFRAASPHFAVDDDIPTGIELVHTLRQIVQGHQISPNVADLIFVRLA